MIIRMMFVMYDFNAVLAIKEGSLPGERVSAARPPAFVMAKSRMKFFLRWNIFWHQDSLKRFWTDSAVAGNTFAVPGTHAADADATKFRNAPPPPRHDAYLFAERRSGDF